AAAGSAADLRARAALALGRIGDERAVPLLRRLLGDSSPEVRRSAAFASGILGEPALAGGLAPLPPGPGGSGGAGAAWSLSALETPAAQDALVSAIGGAAADRRPALLRALWRYATPDAAGAALAHASDPDRATRAAALSALARRPQESSRAALAAAPAGPGVDAATAEVCGAGAGLRRRAAAMTP